MVDTVTSAMKHMVEESKEFMPAKVMPTSTNTLQPTTKHIYEYNANVKPAHKPVPIQSFPAHHHWLDDTATPTADIPFDLSSSQDLDIATPATSPNLLCGYLRIQPSDSIKHDVNATSLSCYIIRGNGYTILDDDTRIEWSAGDLFVIPAQTNGPATHYASAESVGTDHRGVAIYYVHDAPLLDYLAVKASNRRFQPTLFKAETLRGEVEKIKSSPEAAKKNRLGILIGNDKTPHTLTITHTLWALFNVVPAHSVQRPHRHNAVALDLAVDVKPSSAGKVYTLVGNEIDDNGNIVDPVKVDWVSGQAFTTPLGLWYVHSPLMLQLVMITN